MKKHYIILNENGSIRYKSTTKELDEEQLKEKIKYDENNENFQEIKPSKSNLRQLQKALQNILEARVGK